MHSAPSSPNPAPAQRLDGLDLARYLAFVGMVIVNFKIVMGAENEQGLLASLTAMLEGRAAATFVVLAGIGLGLAARRAASPTIATTLKRALFLLAIGLLNMTVFEADILHYYAFYFVFGAVLLPLSTRWLIGAILGLNALFLAMVVLLNYDAGWEWESYSYSGFWTPAGFVRNLFFNGWHPVVPWLGFLLFGVVLSRLALGEWRVQKALVAGGAATLGGAHALSAYLQGVAPSIDPELAALVTTSPIPPAPLYFLAGIGAACAVTGRGAGFLRCRHGLCLPLDQGLRTRPRRGADAQNRRLTRRT